MPTLLEKALGASEENYREIFNASQDALLIHDPKTGAIVDVNQRACEMLKYSREELIKGSLDFLSSGESPYTQEEALGWIHKALSEGPQAFEWLAKDSENKLFWIEVNLKHCVIKGNDRILSASRDITERKKTEDRLKDIYLQQKAILDNIPDMAWLKDKEGRFIAINKPFCKSCGYKPEEIVGKTALDIWPRDLAEIYQADDRDVIETGKRKSVEERLEDKEGRMLYMEIIKTPIYNDKGEIVGTAGIARDVTEKSEPVKRYRGARKSRGGLRRIMPPLPRLAALSTQR
jgi:PAS domain S-box